MATTHTSCFRQILNPLFDLYYVLEIITFGNYNGLDAGPLTLLSPYILSLVNANGPTDVINQCVIEVSESVCHICPNCLRECDTLYYPAELCYGEFKWSGGWSTGTVGWLNTNERGQNLERWPAINTKCVVPLLFLPDLILWSTENRSHGSPVLVPPETQ